MMGEWVNGPSARRLKAVGCQSKNGNRDRDRPRAAAVERARAARFMTVAHALWSSREPVLWVLINPNSCGNAVRGELPTRARPLQRLAIVCTTRGLGSSNRKVGLLTSRVASRHAGARYTLPMTAFISCAPGLSIPVNEGRGVLLLTSEDRQLVAEPLRGGRLARITRSSQGQVGAM